jgi:hypothetical protein
MQKIKFIDNKKCGMAQIFLIIRTIHWKKKITYSWYSHAQDSIGKAIKLSSCQPGMVANLTVATASTYMAVTIVNL